MPDYSLEGVKWGSSGFGMTGGLVTWAADSSLPSGFIADIIAAFADWASFANITFQQVASTASSMIDLSFEPIDGPDHVLGTTNYFFTGNQLTSADIAFDTGEGWTISNGHGFSYDGLRFFPVALHEIGHALGLDHYNSAPAIMNAVLNSSVVDLTSHDVNGIQAIYGAATPKIQGLVDQDFYYKNNPDVASSGISAKDHYYDYGWHEGRDPDAYFSTVGYLATNSDVRAAGINPAQQYDSFGWHEGRDPSVNFDTALYLEHNPDVKAAGIDPLEHYLEHGQAEGRQAYTAVGAPNSFTHGSFDAEYYLLSNPDVARAAIASGQDTYAFAYQHYENYGWHEGRDPNSLFDARGYLAANADVRVAGIDPLTHYDQYGWKEGRDPSVAFDTKGYEAHYADVAAAHIDPLQHYLAYGIHEGRLPFGDGVLA